MGKKENRPSWFKMFLHQKAIIDSVPDETAGKALKAALGYFDTGEVAELDALSGAVFAVLKPYIDESFEDFRRSVDTGRTGGLKRWRKSDTPPIPPLHYPIGVPTEAEAEAEAETDTDTEESCRFPAEGENFTQPTIEEIRAYCINNNYSFDPVYFESYYRARGWMLGNAAMKDWRAVADAWQQKEKKATSEAGKTPYGGREMSAADVESIQRLLSGE